MDGTTRLIVGVLIAVLVVALIAFARREPRHGEPTAAASVALVCSSSAAFLCSWVVSRQIQPGTFSAWQRHLWAPPVAKTASTSSLAAWLAGSQVKSGMRQP